MHEFTAEELLEQLQFLDECPCIEAKKGTDIGGFVMQTVCVFANEPGLRAVTVLDTLSASQELGRLHHQYCLLVKGGAGPETYYQLADWSFDSGKLPLFGNQETANTGDLGTNAGDLGANAGDLPDALSLRIEELTPKTRKDKLWPVILWLCALRSYKAEHLASLLGGRSVKSLKSTHLSVLREPEKMLAYLFTEVVNHPDQVYQTTEKGIQWLREQGVDLSGVA